MYRLGKRKAKKKEKPVPPPALEEVKTEVPPPSPRVDVKPKPLPPYATKVEDAPAPFLLDLLAPANLPDTFAPSSPAPINPEKSA